jgi:hypothetical protein
LAQRLVLMRASAPTGPGGEELRGEFQILQKPFKAGDLLTAVDAALGDVHVAPVER